MAVRPAPAVKKLVVLEEGMLTSMANNPVFLKEFPFLKSLQQAARMRGGCGSCGSRNGSQKATIYTSAKQTLASMGDDKKRTLKKLLNANQVRLTYKQGARVVQHTF